MTIQIITREDCSYCGDAKALLSEEGYSYTEKLIGHDIQREEVLALYPGRKILPVVVIDDRCIGGFSELQEWIASHAAV
jgi:glutaredoxin